jgi:hypothetical protein
MYLNASIPPIHCYLRKEFLYNLEKGHNEFVEVDIFGVASISRRCLSFHCITENGAQITRMPIHAFVTKKNYEPLPFDYLQLWDCFNPNISVTRFEYLKNLKCSVILKNKEWIQGIYHCTFDWSQEDCNGSICDYSEVAGAHKLAHFIKLDNGMFAAQPSNRIIWHEPAEAVNQFSKDNMPDYKVFKHEFTCEQNSKWVTENTDKMYYEFRSRSS